MHLSTPRITPLPQCFLAQPRELQFHKLPSDLQYSYLAKTVTGQEAVTLLQYMCHKHPRSIKHLLA